MNTPQHSIEISENTFFPTELREDWLEPTGILPNANAVIDVLRATGVVSAETFSGIVDLLVPVALVEGHLHLDIEGEDSIREQARTHILGMMNDEVHGDKTVYATGICLSFLTNLRAEEKRFADAALDILTDDSFSGSDEERLEIARIIAGETDELALPDEFASGFTPMTSIEKVDASRELVMESDVEGFLLNFARNLVIVEDDKAHEGKRLRAAINLVEYLVPMTRMFGPSFRNISERGWQSAWGFIQGRSPEVVESISEIQGLARRTSRPTGELIQGWIDNTDARIVTSRVKDAGSTVLKRLRKGIGNFEDLADVLGFRIVAADEPDMEKVLKNILDAFKYKDGTYKLVTTDYIIELGRHVPDDVENVSPDDESAIVLDIKQSSALFDLLGRPPKVLAGKPKDSGFETVYVNLIVRKKGSSIPLNVEIQVVTEEMLKSNKIGKAVVAVYKLNPSSAEDFRRAEDIMAGVSHRTDAFARGYHELALKTQIRMLEHWPEIDNNLAELYRVVSVGGKLVTIPKELENVIDHNVFSDKFQREATGLTILPVGHVTEAQFKAIIATEMPAWFAGKTALKDGLWYASKWHSAQKRGTGVNHYEGHILPLTLAYFLNLAARGEEVSQDDLVSMLLHDSLEDSKDQYTQRERIIRSTFSEEVQSSVYIQTKPIKQSHESGVTIDTSQAEKLAGLKGSLGESEVLKKVIDRTGSHIGDLIFTIKSGVFKPKMHGYLLNSRKVYAKLFERDPISKGIWFALEDIFNYVRNKYTTSV